MMCFPFMTDPLIRNELLSFRFYGIGCCYYAGQTGVNLFPTTKDKPQSSGEGIKRIGGFPLPKASERRALILLFLGGVRQLFYIAGNLKLMPGHLLQRDGNAPQQRDEENGHDAEIWC